MWVIMTIWTHRSGGYEDWWVLQPKFGEQMASKRFEDLGQKLVPSGEGGTQLPPTSTASSIAGHHPSGRLTSPESPHLKSLSIQYCSFLTVSL
ncbi:hypothetical protein KIN20_029156 [Parelaphostrongylus tenuis]|uniref:Uncharacterized protein n=1 Tax=Parelaphostrongylus tenuis TaxID=148309 RepID=A0AAD5WFD8_PARTN|nr:hypothetical protein KIN20_029156 [Parelaphostrongylus tenuis]